MTFCHDLYRRLIFVGNFLLCNSIAHLHTHTTQSYAIYISFNFLMHSCNFDNDFYSYKNYIMHMCSIYNSYIPRSNNDCLVCMLHLHVDSCRKYRLLLSNTVMTVVRAISRMDTQLCPEYELVQ